MIKQIKHDLQKIANTHNANHSVRFFKTGKGEYGEGDLFIGGKTADQRKIAKKYWRQINLVDNLQLLHSPIHEHRFTALLILILKFTKADEKQQNKIFKLYLNNTKYINSWDLVDLSAPKIVGAYLLKHPEKKLVLYKLAKSESLWQKRIAMLSTLTLIKQSDFIDALKIAEILLYDKHDLIHKAVGWMLREIGKIDQTIEEKFLEKYTTKMPRTMLRYAIEKFAEDKRQYYLKKH